MSNEISLSTLGANEMMFNDSFMSQVEAVADKMASGKSTVPAHLRGSKSDCFAVIMQAAQWGMNPFAVAQKTFLVSGVLGYEAQLVNAVISSSRAIKGRFKYEYDGDWEKTNSPNSNACIRVGAVFTGDDAITWGEWLFIGSVGVKNSPLWKTAPKQQASYLAVKYWARLFCPEIILGVYTPEELETIEPDSADESTGEIIDAIMIDDVLARIESAKNMDDLKNESLSNDILKLTDAEISIARKAWSEKKDIFKAEFVENSKINTPELTLDIINKCKSADDLSEIVKSLSQEDLLEYNDNIDEKFDSFRV